MITLGSPKGLITSYHNFPILQGGDSGPETISWLSSDPGRVHVVFVYRYSYMGSLTQSGARVDFYGPGGEVTPVVLDQGEETGLR